MSKKLTTLAIFGLALIFAACGQNNNRNGNGNRTQVNPRVRQMAARDRAQQMDQRGQVDPRQTDPSQVVARVDTPAPDREKVKDDDTRTSPDKKELTEVEKDCLQAIKNIAADVTKVVYKIDDKYEQDFEKATVDGDHLRLTLKDDDNTDSDLTFELDSGASSSYKCVLVDEYETEKSNKDITETIELTTDKPSKYDDDDTAYSIKGKKQEDDKTPKDVSFEFSK